MQHSVKCRTQSHFSKHPTTSSYLDSVKCSTQLSAAHSLTFSKHPTTSSYLDSVKCSTQLSAAHSLTFQNTPLLVLTLTQLSAAHSLTFQNTPLLVLTLTQLSAAHSLTFCFFNIHFNIILVFESNFFGVASSIKMFATLNLDH